MAHGQKKTAKCRSLYIFSLFFFTLYGPRPKTGKVPISIFLFPLFFILNIYFMAHGQKRQSANLYTFLYIYIYIYIFYSLWPTARKTGKVPISIFSIFLFPVFYTLLPTAKNRQSAYLYISIPSFFILNIYSMAHGQKRQSANLYTSFFIYIYIFYSLWPTAKNRQSAYLYILYISFPCFFLYSIAHGQKPAKCLSLYSLYFFSLFFFILYCPRPKTASADLCSPFMCVCVCVCLSLSLSLYPLTQGPKIKR